MRQPALGQAVIALWKQTTVPGKGSGIGAGVGCFMEEVMFQLGLLGKTNSPCGGRERKNNRWWKTLPDRLRRKMVEEGGVGQGTLGLYLPGRREPGKTFE